MKVFIGHSTEGNKCVFCGKDTGQYDVFREGGMSISMAICPNCYKKEIRGINSFMRRKLREIKNFLKDEK